MIGKSEQSRTDNFRDDDEKDKSPRIKRGGGGEGKTVSQHSLESAPQNPVEGATEPEIEVASTLAATEMAVSARSETNSLDEVMTQFAAKEREVVERYRALTALGMTISAWPDLGDIARLGDFLFDPRLYKMSNPRLVPIGKVSAGQTSTVDQLLPLDDISLLNTLDENETRRLIDELEELNNAADRILAAAERTNKALQRCLREAQGIHDDFVAVSSHRTVMV